MFKICLIDDLLDGQDMPSRHRADLRRRRRHLCDEISRCMDIERKMLMADQRVSERDKLNDIEKRRKRILDDIDRWNKRILRDMWLFEVVHCRLPYIAYALAVMAAIAVALHG